MQLLKGEDPRVHLETGGNLLPGRMQNMGLISEQDLLHFELVTAAWSSQGRVQRLHDECVRDST